jgi:sporulation protein YlmC with PRC-barrel domain
MSAETSKDALDQPANLPAAPGSGRDGGRRLVRAKDLIGLDVVTMEGNRTVEVKDVVFDPHAGTITGFTLRKPGLLGGPQQHVLPVAGVDAVGRDAVMIASHHVFADADALAGSGDDVLGDRVITDEGTELGKVVDVAAAISGGTADVAGFEISPAESYRPDGHNVFVPLPAAHAISGEAIVVPASVVDYVAGDLLGLQKAVVAFREHLEQT